MENNVSLLFRAATDFITAYKNFLTDTNDPSDTIAALLATMVPDPTSPYEASKEPVIKYSGKSGFLPWFGEFRGSKGITNAVLGLANATDTESLQVDEILDTSFAIDFSLLPGSPLIPQANRVAVLFDERQKIRNTGLRYNLDNVLLLTVADSGRVSDAHFYYDSYVVSQAASGTSLPLIANPDLETVLNPRRNYQTTIEQTINSAFGFFGTFAGIDAQATKISPDSTDKPDFSPLLNTVTDDVVLKFSGDPRILPFADNQIRVGKNAVAQTFLEQFTDSRPRLFDMNEWFVSGDRLLANTFEKRTAVATRIGYEVDVQILLTSKDGKIGSVEGIYDSVTTATAFVGKQPFNAPQPTDAIVGLQGDASGFINLTGVNGSKVQVKLAISSDAVYNNSVGLFVVDDITGVINGIKPGEAGWLDQAFASTVLVFDRGGRVAGRPEYSSQELTTTLNAGVILAAYVVANGTAQTLKAQNPGNTWSPTGLNAYFSIKSANPDGNLDHFSLSGSRFFAEDQWGLGDNDKNDMVFDVLLQQVAA